MSASGHQRKCSEGSNDVRFAAPSGHDCADLAGPFSADFVAEVGDHDSEEADAIF
jgi:hypothetical protein